MIGRWAQTAALVLPAAVLVVGNAFAAGPSITSFTRSGLLTWTNAIFPGVCTIEAKSAVNNEWLPFRNIYSTNAAGSSPTFLNVTNQFFRLRSTDISATPQGFTNLVYAYGLL